MTALATENKHDSGKAPASLLPLQQQVAEELKQVNDVIFNSVTQDVRLIVDIGRHIMASGGKRLRPTLTIGSAKLCGYEGSRHIHLAATVELLHTATLLHDDVVDESTLRRGEETANVIWSNQASVLVGDYMLSRAFQLMVADGSLEVLRILADASATISKGEVMQMGTANNPATTRQTYLDVVAAKTAALFAAACELGPVVSARPEWQQTMRIFGTELGMAFQLVDDALDYSANQKLLGKAVGDDFREGKITLPVITAYQKGTDSEREFWHRTVERLEQKENDLEEAIALIEKHNGLNETVDAARDYISNAKARLNEAFPGSPLRHAFEEMLDFCVERAY